MEAAVESLRDFNSTATGGNVTNATATSNSPAMTTADASFATAVFFVVFACLWCIVFGKLVARYENSRRSIEPEPATRRPPPPPHQGSHYLTEHQELKTREERKKDLLDSFKQHNVQMVRQIRRIKRIRLAETSNQSNSYHIPLVSSRVSFFHPGFFFSCYLMP